MMKLNARRRFRSITQVKVRLAGVCALILLIASVQQLKAQQTETQNIPAFHQPQVELTPYIWGLQINSDDQLGDQPLNATLPLGKILKGLRGLAELEVVPRYKNMFLFGDGVYASLTLSPKPGQAGLDHVNLQAGLVTAAAGYSFGPLRIQRDGHKPVYVSFQPFAGAAYTDLAVTARSPALTTVARVSQNWWMPIVGGRIDVQSGNLLARIQGDFSKFDSSENSEQVLGAVGYQLQKKKFGYPSLNLGYRYLYEKKVVGASEVLRAKLQGPLVFATFHF